MMKRLLLLLTVLFSMAVAQAADKPAPKISFAEKTHDFGVIQEADGPVSFLFRFTNDGDAPLVILTASAECGCTKPSYTKEPIEPGGDGAIKVTYNPAGRPGEFDKSVIIKTNDKKAKKITLKISGVVIPK